MLENQHLKTRVYSPGGTGDNFFAIWRSIIREFWLSHGLGFRLASRNISARYRRSLLGFLWAFLPPIVTSIVWIVLNDQKIVQFGKTDIPYPLFVVCGTTLWQMFTSAVVIPIQTVNASKSILSKINFPREAILINAFYEILFNVVIGMIIIGAMLIYSGINPGFSALLYLPLILQLILIGFTVSLFLLPLSLLYSDVQYLLPTALQFVMYLTPVIYPKPVLTSFEWLFKYNPVGLTLQYIRGGITNSVVDVTTLDFVTVGLATLGLFVVGVVLFRITMEVLIERMGS